MQEKADFSYLLIGYGEMGNTVDDFCVLIHILHFVQSYEMHGSPFESQLNASLAIKLG